MNDVERLLWWRIRGRQGGCHSRRQIPIGPYVADFACLGHRLVVECDGSQHLENADHDEERDRYLQRLGFTVLRFWDSEIMSDLESVIDTIAHHCDPG